MSGKHFWKQSFASLVPEIAKWAFGHGVPLENAIRTALCNRGQVWAHSQYAYLRSINVTESLEPLEEYEDHLGGDKEDNRIFLQLTDHIVRRSLEAEKHEMLLSLSQAKADARRAMAEIPAVSPEAWKALFHLVTQHWEDDVAEQVRSLGKIEELLKPHCKDMETPVETLKRSLTELEILRKAGFIAPPKKPVKKEKKHG